MTTSSNDCPARVPPGHRKPTKQIHSLWAMAATWKDRCLAAQDNGWRFNYTDVEGAVLYGGDGCFGFVDAEALRYSVAHGPCPENHEVKVGDGVWKTPNGALWWNVYAEDWTLPPGLYCDSLECVYYALPVAAEPPEEERVMPKTKRFTGEFPAGYEPPNSALPIAAESEDRCADCCGELDQRAAKCELTGLSSLSCAAGVYYEGAPICFKCAEVRKEDFIAEHEAGAAKWSAPEVVYRTGWLVNFLVPYMENGIPDINKIEQDGYRVTITRKEEDHE